MVWKALRAAFPHTIPIFAGFWFLGMAYGIYMNALGFSFVYPALMALFIFGGSLEFVAGSMLVASFAPVQALLLAFIIQARHLFYGIAMLDRFRGLGWKRPYLIFGMCDETFSINYAADISQDVDRGWFMFFVTLLTQIYWVSGAALVCRLVFPVDSFLIPTMIVILVALTLLRRPIERRAIERKSLRKAGANV